MDTTDGTVLGEITRLDCRAWLSETAQAVPVQSMKIVKRYLRGRCYAALWNGDTTDEQIVSCIKAGDATFWPYDEGTATFRYDLARSGRRFRR